MRITLWLMSAYNYTVIIHAERDMLLKQSIQLYLIDAKMSSEAFIYLDIYAYKYVSRLN